MFLGLDVGKDAYHAVGLDPAGRRLHGGPLPNSEPKPRALFDKLAGHGPLLVVADHPATTGDNRGVASHGRPRGRSTLATKRRPSWRSWSGSTTTWPAKPPRLGNRIRGLTGITQAGRRKRTAIAKVHAPRRGDKLVDAIMTALDEQTVIVPGTAAADTVLPRLADSLTTVLQQRKQVAEQVEGILDAHPLAGVLTSMPGIGVRTAARILLEVGDASNFASSGDLAAYAGIAPVTRTSGPSIKGEHPARTGNRKLTRAYFLAAFAALSDQTSRTYYDRERAESKKHNAALICLVRRRRDVLYAMRRNGTHYRHHQPARPA